MHKLRPSIILFIIPMIFFSSCGNKTLEQPVNILFLMSDQHRGDALGSAGSEEVFTPSLDQLASEGILFTRAYSSVPSCLPARTAILTGMSPWASGQLGYKPIPDYPTEGPAIFTNNGYRTHAIGKNHFRPMRNKHGYQTVTLEEAWYTVLKDQEKCDYSIWFEQEYPEEDLNASGLGYTDHRGGRSFPFEDKAHPTHWTAEKAIEFLKSYDEDMPWLLKVSFKRPHPPFDPPERWFNQYSDIDVSMPNVSTWANDKYGHKNGSLEKSPDATSGVFPHNDIILSKKSYFAGLSFVDEQIGRILNALKERGEYNNTLILYTSDHGDMMGDQHMWRKCRPYEGSTRIPMIIRWPESLNIQSERGIISHELVELRDVFPSFLDAAGIGIPEAMDGMSMIDILEGEKWREILDLEHAQIYEPFNAWVALTDNRYKYIYFTLTGEDQLFDLSEDPNEMVDLTNNKKQSQELISSWRQSMVDHLAERGENWVKGGKLVIQDSSIYYGRNHPYYQKSE